MIYLECIRILPATLLLIQITPNLLCCHDFSLSLCRNGKSVDVCHEKTDLKVFFVVIPKEGWASVATKTLRSVFS